MPKKRIQSRLRTVTCATCSKKFQTRHSQGKYCNPECRQIGWRASWNKYSSNNRAARRANERRIRRADPDKRSAQLKRWRESAAGKKSIKAHDKRMREKYPEKHLARQEVRKAILRGDLVKQPCRCGETKVHAHHHDYSKPLDVEWLCAPCHRIEHPGHHSNDGEVANV